MQKLIFTKIKFIYISQKFFKPALLFCLKIKFLKIFSTIFIIVCIHKATFYTLLQLHPIRHSGIWSHSEGTRTLKTFGEHLDTWILGVHQSNWWFGLLAGTWALGQSESTLTRGMLKHSGIQNLTALRR